MSPLLRVQKVEVKLKRPLEQISPPEFKRGLLRSPTFDWLPVAISGDEIIPEVAAQAPIDGVEIVKWMTEAAAYNAVLDAMAEEYSRCGSFFASKVGDPYIPGVGIGSGTRAVRYTSVTGRTVVEQRGAYFIVGTQRFFCPEFGAATAVLSDIFAWAAIPARYAIQWIGALVRWLRDDLAKTPINERVRFANIRGLVAPNFFVVQSQAPPPAQMVSIGFTSNRDQKVGFQIRSYNDFTNVLSSDTLEVPAGESTMDYFILGFPFIEPWVAHFQPESGTETVLDSLTVFPP